MNISKLEGDFVRSIKESTTEFFSTMLMTDVKADEPFIKDEKNIFTDLISSVHFFGEKYMGKVAVFTDGATACNLAGAMLGMEVSEVDEDVKDGMGEIVNMIAGGAKVKLESTMGELHLLTPWVITGRGMTIASPSGGEDGLSIESQAQFSWVMTKFSYDKGHFLVGVQPSEVPQSNTSNTQKKISELQDEIIKLRNENTSLRSSIRGADMVV